MSTLLDCNGLQGKAATGINSSNKACLNNAEEDERLTRTNKGGERRKDSKTKIRLIEKFAGGNFMLFF